MFGKAAPKKCLPRTSKRYQKITRTYRKRVCRKTCGNFLLGNFWKITEIFFRVWLLCTGTFVPWKNCESLASCFVSLWWQRHYQLQLFQHMRFECITKGLWGRQTRHQRRQHLGFQKQKLFLTKSFLFARDTPKVMALHRPVKNNFITYLLLQFRIANTKNTS